MKLHNAHTKENIKLSEFFEGKISVSFDGETMPEEIAFLEPAIALVNELIKTSPPDNPLLSLNIYFITGDSAEFVFDDESVMGCYSQFIFLPVKHWRKYKLNRGQILFTIVEELCHAVWGIPDGPLIEKKVEGAFKTIDPDFDYFEFLAKMPLIDAH